MFVSLFVRSFGRSVGCSLVCSFARSFVRSFVRLFILLSFHFLEPRKLNAILSSELALCVKQRSVHPRSTVSLCCGFDFLTASSYKVRMNAWFISTFLHLSIDSVGSIFNKSRSFSLFWQEHFIPEKNFGMCSSLFGSHSCPTGSHLSCPKPQDN